MKNLVIIGAGFAGMATALGLEKRFKQNTDISITLVDKHDYHLFSPCLHEVATYEEEFASVTQMKRSVALPIKEILENKKINFVHGEFTRIDQQAKTVTIGIKKLHYDALVIAVGGKTDYLKVEGAEEFSLSLKSLPDALRMRNAIEFAVESHKYDLTKQLLRFVVAGGDYSAVELAGELKNLLDVLSWKYSYPRRCLEIVVAAPGSALVPGYGKKMSEDVLERLTDLGVKVLLHQRIIKVDKHFIEFLNGEKMQHELLLWVWGTKATSLPVNFPANKKAQDRVEVDEYLRSKGTDNIFVIGDMAYTADSHGQPLPQGAEQSINQGRYVANALPFILRNQIPKSYFPKQHGIIVKVSGKWAVVNIAPFYFKGYFAYLANLISHFGYYCSLVGVKKAFRYVIREMDLFSRND